MIRYERDGVLVGVAGVDLRGALRVEDARPAVGAVVRPVEGLQDGLLAASRAHMPHAHMRNTVCLFDIETDRWCSACS